MLGSITFAQQANIMLVKNFQMIFLSIEVCNFHKNIKNPYCPKKKIETFFFWAVRWRRKKLQGCQLFIFHQSRHHILCFYSMREISDWVRSKGIETSKNKKNQQQPFFLFGLLKWNCSKTTFLKIWKNHK
jgi:hypothetical protein